MSVNANTRKFITNMCRLRYTHEASEIAPWEAMKSIIIKGKDFDELIEDMTNMNKALDKSWRCITQFHTFGYKYSWQKTKVVLHTDYMGYYAEVTKRQTVILDIWADTWKEAKEIHRVMLLKGYTNKDFTPLFEEIEIAIINRTFIDPKVHKQYGCGTLFRPHNI
jgi:hypothetical protein